MSAYCSLVNVDADTASKLVEFVAAQLGEGATAATFKGECDKLLASESYSTLVLKLLEKHEVILALENEGDVEGFFQALVTVTLFNGGTGGGSAAGQDSLTAIQKAVDALTGKVDARSKLRLRILVSLFNMSFTAHSKHFVICAIFKYALASSQTSLVYAFHTRVAGWVEEWNLPAVDKRSLFLLVSEVLESAKESSLALSFFVLYLSAFGKDASLPADALGLAIATVKSAIKSPVTGFADRSALLESISQQQATGALAPLLELLRIVCCDTLPAFRTFEARHKALLAEHDISAEDLSNKMRLLTLCSLGTETQNPTYSQVSKALDVPEDDVELWVVEAMAAGLLEANMDQFQKQVTITRCAHRRFGPEQWQGIKAKLVDLDKKVTGALSFFQHGDQS